MRIYTCVEPDAKPLLFGAARLIGIKIRILLLYLFFTMLCLCTEIYVWAQTRHFKNRVSEARHGFAQNRCFRPKSPPLKMRVELKFQTELTMYMGWGLPRQKLA